MEQKGRNVVGLSLLAVVAASLATGGAAGQDPLQWTPELSMKFRTVGNPAITADGERAAFEVREAVMEDETSEYRTQIWVARTDGSSTVQYTRADTSSTAPDFSADGKLLAYLRKAPSGDDDKEVGQAAEASQIFVMSVSGGEPRAVTGAEGGVSSFAWAPAGRRIAYVGTDPKSKLRKEQEKEKSWVRVVDRDLRHGHLYVIDVLAAGEGLPEPTRLTEGALHVTSLDWAPDGGRIAIGHRPDPRINSRIYSDISVVDVDSGELTPLVTWEGADAAPHFSPDGERIAFASHGGERQDVGQTDVFVVAASGGIPKPLAHTPDRSATVVGWSDELGEVLVTETFRTTRRIYGLAADTSGTGHSTSPMEEVVTSLAIADEAPVGVAVLQGPELPPDVYVVDLDPWHPKRISDLHAEIEMPAMGRTELLDWKSEDGLQIEGLLTLPVGYREGQRVPLVLNVHGGPAGAFTRGFTGGPSLYMIQVFAQNGYAVLRPNPRGSTGYGTEFRHANVADWGYGDFEDLMSGVDKVVADGIADPQRLFLMGWSYGGYMTSFAVTKTDRFRAASMGAGLSNLVSMVHTSDIPDYLVAHMGGELWDRYEVYQKHSAIYRVERVKTPTQILHGERDLRVPLSQGQEFYLALDRLDVPTEMAVYPRTPHGPREPRLLMDVTPRILAWFEKHQPAAQPSGP
ncbi:MAG: S9 family peptidase [Acidobacteriota bacterium]|nr:S9 family peptidase [Acidobacteriota bacterium]